MAYSYIYSFYFREALESGKIIVNDMNHILDNLDTLSDRRMCIVSDYEYNYEHVLRAYACDFKIIERDFNRMRGMFKEYNELLDKYHITEEMRFDEYDLIGSVRFYRALFYFLPESEGAEIVERRRKSKYPYQYYLNGLPAADWEHIVELLKTITDRDRMIVRDYKTNYQNTIGCGYFADMDGVKRELEEIRDKFKAFNAELDKYNVDPEMRFDETDLVDAIHFHWALFTYLPEADCEKVIKLRREQMAHKSEEPIFYF